MSLRVEVARALSALHAELLAKSGDKSNTGKHLASLYIWDELAAATKGRSDAEWDKLIEQGVISAPPEVEGEYQLAQSPGFAVACKCSKPVRRFNADELAKILQKKHKVPLPASKEAIEAAKLPTKPIKTLSVSERV